MEDEVLKDYIQKQLYKKGIDIRTQDYITEYIHMNQKLFGNILNTNKIVDRITNNLQSSVETFNHTKGMNIIDRVVATINYDGLYDATSKKIFVNPIMHIMGYASKNVSKREKSTIMHEIDHAATTNEYSVNENDKDKYINGFADIMSKSNPKNREKIIGKLNDGYEKHGMKIHVSGIDDVGIHIDQGFTLRCLNEGITAYKQGMYDEFSGIKPKTGYREEKKLAQKIANAIGKENLIAMHFDGNYEGIRQMFNDKTGQELNYLVKELNSIVQFKDPISRTMYKMVRKIINRNNVMTLASANEKNNDDNSKPKTLQEQLNEQVNDSRETLIEDVKDINTQTKEKTLDEKKQKMDVRMENR